MRGRGPDRAALGRALRDPDTVSAPLPGCRRRGDAGSRHRPDAQEVALDVDADESVWDAATREGIGLPSMCLPGWCTTCAERVLDGEFDPAEALRYYPEDRAAGFILLCTPGRAAPCAPRPTSAKRCARIASRPRPARTPRLNDPWI
jgi:ferredoxin